MPGQEDERRDYFRRDQSSGISPPDLRKDCTFAEHIVHARGKRTNFTSVSLDAARIRDFGDTTYQLDQDVLAEDSHGLVQHGELVEALRQAAREQSKAEKTRAIRAIAYAQRRREGLVDWKFDVSGVQSKDVINWAQNHVQKYFRKA